MNKHVFDLLTNVLVVCLVGCIPGGLALAYYYDNAAWIILSAFALIVLAAG